MARCLGHSHRRRPDIRRERVVRESMNNALSVQYNITVRADDTVEPDNI